MCENITRHRVGNALPPLCSAQVVTTRILGPEWGLLPCPSSRRAPLPWETPCFHFLLSEEGTHRWKIHAAGCKEIARIGKPITHKPEYNYGRPKCILGPRIYYGALNPPAIAGGRVCYNFLWWGHCYDSCASTATMIRSQVAKLSCSAFSSVWYWD